MSCLHWRFKNRKVPNNQMECAICFSPCEKPCTLTCTHVFCRSCIMKWLESPVQLEKPTCPMCRGPTLFKGIQRVQYSLEEKRWESAYADTYAEIFDDLLHYTVRLNDLERRVFEMHTEVSGREYFAQLLSKRSTRALRDFEKMFRLMKENGEHPEAIDDVLTETNINYEKAIKRAKKQMWRTREPRQNLSCRKVWC